MPAISEFDYRYNMLIKTFASRPEPAFETAAEQIATWGRAWGCDNDVGQIRLVLMHRPGPEMAIVDAAKKIPGLNAFGDPDTGWYWRGEVIPDFDEMRAEHDAYVAALREEGAEVVYLDRAAPGRIKSVYTRDSVIAVKGGAIVTRLGPSVRRGEEAPVTRTLAGLGMPILRTISGTGILEGGSFVWLRPDVAVLGLSSRINAEGARQLEEVLATQGVRLLKVHLPGYQLHIDGMLVMVDRDTAFVNPAHLPFWFLEELNALGIRQIEVCPDDPTGIINCLAVRPGRVLIGNGLSDRTRERFERLGIETRRISYDKVALGGGGLHCSTAPLIRDPC